MSEITGKILKKETVDYRKSAISKQKGSLVLTPTKLYFAVQKGLIKKTEEIVLDIGINDVINVKAKKAFGYGIEHLEIAYSDGNKEKKVTFEHMSLASYSIGAMARLEGLYFADWQKAIEEQKNKKTDSSDLENLERLSDLKNKGVINNEEFEAKKKQILGL